MVDNAFSSVQKKLTVLMKYSCIIFPQLLSLTGSNFRSLNYIFKLLLKFLMYLMHHSLTGFGDEVDCNTLKYPQVKLLVLLCFLENHP